MKRLMFSLVLYYCAFIVTAQTISSHAILSAGDNFNNSSAQIFWTLGELQISTYSNNELILTQGLLQSNITITALKPEKNVENIKLVVFPNPVKKILYIRLPDTDIDLEAFLYDQNGKIILQKPLINRGLENINIVGKANGLYLLKVQSKTGNFTQNFKIIINN